MMMRMAQLISLVSRLWRPALSACVALVASSCIEWSQPLDSEAPTIANYVSAVSTANGAVTASLQTGSPTITGATPVVTAPIPTLVLLGGTIQVTASAPTPFSKLAVVVPGLDDYWELQLPGAVTSVDLLIAFSQNVPVPVFEVRMAGSAGGAYGTAQSSPVSTIAVGTGDVQVNITWDSDADVDLHVVDPIGEEIFYAHKFAVSGGQLDLDSNAGCGSDGPRAENIFWSSGLIAPKGEYLVRVNYWSACQATRTNYVVTVNTRGQPPKVFTGFFTGSGNGGGKGSGRVITRATY
jgi:hypothetical protein